MKRNSILTAFIGIAGLLLVSVLPSAVLAEGTEVLGDPLIPLADGTGVVAAGTGLKDQPGTIDISIPAGASVKQVLLYWSGEFSVSDDDTVVVNGNPVPVTGALIGGPTFFFTASGANIDVSAFRADITSLGLVAPGPNTLTIDGLNYVGPPGSLFENGNHGAGVLVIIDEGGTQSSIQVRDGVDLAFCQFPEPRQTTIPQVYTFAPANVLRVADLNMFFGSVKGGDQAEFRPNLIEITVSGGGIDPITTTLLDPLQSLDGEQWDTVVELVDIPVGADTLTVQAISGSPTPGLCASFTWVGSTLSVPLPPAPEIEIEKFTNGYDADDADGFPITTPPPGPFEVGDTKVPLVAIGDDITWTYKVKNTGSEPLVNVMVTDNQGVTVTCPQTTLDPGEEITCIAMGVGLDLTNTMGTVEGCDAQGQGMTQPTYENFGEVVAVGETSGVEVTDDDPSHYCNPPDVMVEKFTNGHDGDDANGIPDPNGGGFQVGAATVAEIPSNGGITWSYRVTNTGTETLENVTVTDSQGVAVTCPQTTLLPGESIDCTATGSAEDLVQTGGDVDGCGSGTGETRPTYENLGTVTGNGQVSGVLVEDDDPSHYCNPPPPPPCGLTVQKGCELPPPPAPDGKCEGKLQQFTMIWTGGPITVSGPANDAPGGQVGTGDEVTFFGPFSSNDVIVNVNGGQSTFHVSCSDKDMDGDTTTNEDQQQVSSFGRDCGKFQGDGKGSSGINDWLLEGFVDKDGAVLDCTDDAGPLASVCEFNAIPADCDNPDKPDNLTWLYSGGGCTASDNDQGSSGDLFCTGSIDGNSPVTITDDKDNVFNVEPGGVFTTTRDASKVFTLVNGGGTEENGRHVSCSQPLQAGDVYGSLTLVGLDGLGLGTNVTYSYLVSNDGQVPVTDIIVTDDQLGDIGMIDSLQPGDSETLTAEAFISETTTNVATVDGSGAPGAICLADSSPVVVKVLPPPPCDVGIVFDKLEDDKIKWKLTNNSVFGKATLQTFTLDFPAGFDVIKKVKLDGDIYKVDDSDTFPDGVGSGETIGEDDWTKDDVTKRELEQGETRTLEVEFEEKDTSASPSDFDLILTFEEGCMVAF